ncbi:uncharacterized protein [Montipora capricornis]|uniref:uncharacterized protein n=1 Tax=Montipora capricornis TaxID=246305 RepID=UPI0035F1CC21
MVAERRFITWINRISDDRASIWSCVFTSLLQLCPPENSDDNAQHFSCDVVKKIERDFCVDDCLKSLPSVKDAITHVRELCSLLQRGGFRLTKWVSSSREVLESIPVKDRGQEIKKLNLQKDELPVERALGVQWRIEDDTFGFNVNLKPKALPVEAFCLSWGQFSIPLVLSPLSS